jgi:hypothetical protein
VGYKHSRLNEIRSALRERLTKRCDSAFKKIWVPLSAEHTINFITTKRALYRTRCPRKMLLGSDTITYKPCKFIEHAVEYSLLKHRRKT